MVGMGRTTGGTLGFRAAPATVGAVTIMRLPPEVSGALPSRGQVAVRASVNGHGFATVLEPDGRRGHWIKLDQDLQHAAALVPGEPAEVTVEIAPEWPEPEVPADLAAALRAAPRPIQDIWRDITPMARWEWVRWVNATANPATRRRRVEVSVAKLGSGKRRPCCFDLSACTDPSVASSGRLRAATD